MRPIKVESAPNPNREIYDYLILDMSGSMSTIKQATMTGVNGYIDTMKKTAEKVKSFCSLLLFDHRFVSVYNFTPAQEVKPLTDEVYRPEGWTALNDAVGRAIEDLKVKLAGREDSEDVDVTITIFTDGEENKSEKYPGKGNTALLGLIEEIKNNWGWTFAFVGAGSEEAVTRQAATVGVAAGNVAAYQATTKGATDVTRRMSAARMYKSTAFATTGQSVSTNYFVPDNSISANTTDDPTHQNTEATDVTNI